MSEDLSKYATSSLMSDSFFLINKINKNFRDLQRNVIKTHKVTIPQYCVIRHIGKSGGLQFKDLALGCHCSRPTMTGIIDTMERKKLVARVQNPEDRRSLLVVLTEKGKRLYDSIPIEESIFKNCCTDLLPNEIQQLNNLLVKFLEHFGKVNSKEKE